MPNLDPEFMLRMIDIENFLAVLRRYGITIAVDGSDLLVEPVDLLDDSLIAVLRERKPDILAYLALPGGIDGDLWPPVDRAGDHPGPCRQCGSLEQRQDAVGEWHCQRCEPRDASRSDELARLAQELRERFPATPSGREAPRQLIGVPYPTRKAPTVPEAIKADPIKTCKACGHNRVLVSVPGSKLGVCFTCWLSSRN